MYRVDVSFNTSRNTDFSASGTVDKVLSLENYDDIICMGFRLAEPYDHFNGPEVKSSIKLPSKLPKKLKYLYYHNCQIEKLPELPESLVELYCDDNNLSYLPKLPETLRVLHCKNNNIVELPKLPKSLINSGHIIISNNTVSDFIDDNFNIYRAYNKWLNKRRESANKIGEWYLDCKYNPSFLKCRKRLRVEHEELYNTL